MIQKTAIPYVSGRATTSKSNISESEKKNNLREKDK